MWKNTADKHYGKMRDWYPFIHHLRNKSIHTFEGMVKELCPYANSLVDRRISANEGYELLAMDSKRCEIRIHGNVPEFHYALASLLPYILGYLKIKEFNDCNIEVFKFLNIKIFASEVVIFRIVSGLVVPVYTFRLCGGMPSEESWITDIPSASYGNRDKRAKERLVGVDLSGNPVQVFAKFIRAMDNTGERIKIQNVNGVVQIYTSSHEFIKMYMEVFVELVEKNRQVYVFTRYNKKRYILSFEGVDNIKAYEYEIRSIKNGMLLTK